MSIIALFHVQPKSMERLVTVKNFIFVTSDKSCFRKFCLLLCIISKDQNCSTVLLLLVGVGKCMMQDIHSAVKEITMEVYIAGKLSEDGLPR